MQDMYSTAQTQEICAATAVDMQIIRLPPGNMTSWIIQIRNNVSALKDLDH